nr:glycoside hydrolase family 2 TIM barrel-domain containing protein [uncultured Butyrivibrio sp.]
MRKEISLKNSWKFAKESDLVSAFPQGWEEITLPHTFNNIDGQDGGNDYFRGAVQYVRLLDYPVDDADCAGKCAFLEFKGAAMTADVFLNGQKIAHHEGGYSTFRCEVTEVLHEGENLLAVLVDNSANETVYPQKADFTFYGGLYRDVNLILTEKEHFECVLDGSDGIKITPEVMGKDAKVTCEAWANSGEKVEFKIYSSDGDSFEAEAALKNGYAITTIDAQNVHLWDGIDDPFLYSVEARLISDGAEKDTVATRIGFRSFKVTPDEGFFLNGRSYPLRGVSRHQDREGAGNALTLEMHKEDMELIKEIGANTIRLAHYQHAQEFYDLCDENGMVVWAEIPYITKHMDSGKENTLSQMRELVTQCYHHPSIVCWALSNEITASGEITENLLENHRELNDLCHKLDKTRLTTMAHVFMLDTKNPIIDIPDIGSYNLYYGWYLGELTQNEEFFDKFHKEYPNRIIGFSEYGADANPKYHSSNPVRSDYTEEYQCLYHEHILKCINERPYLWATHVWNMFDFAADGRDEGGNNGKNQKGLVTIDRRLKKDVFFLYKAAWNKKEPFVHVCGRRYVDRAEDRTQVKVYSNQPIVSLYIDGEFFMEKTGDIIFEFEVELSGEHTITAKAGDLQDEIVIRRVKEPNKSYVLEGSKAVRNWFDDETDAAFFSIKDTMKDLRSNPGSAAILGRMMEKVTKSRGEVAQAAQKNEALQKMMENMTLESLLSQAGSAVSDDDIINLNQALQKIRK